MRVLFVLVIAFAFCRFLGREVGFKRLGVTAAGWVDPSFVRNLADPYRRFPLLYFRKSIIITDFSSEG